VQLIDVLESRSDSVLIVDSPEKVEAHYRGQWEFTLDDADYDITEDALNTLLNLLRIPIKYITRCVEEEEEASEHTYGMVLAENSINYWLEKYGDVSFLVTNSGDTKTITQVFGGRKLYIPGVKINDLIFEYLGRKSKNVAVMNYTASDDMFGAVYITDEVYDILGGKCNLGVRVLYSDCFAITPRFDGVLVRADDQALVAFPTTGRKFRVAGSNIPIVFDQIEEFLDLSVDGLRETLIPALERIADRSDQILHHKSDVIDRLCAELRVSKKIKDEVNEWFEMENYFHDEMVSIIAQKTNNLPEDSNIDVELARSIQIAMTNFVLRRSFK